MKLTRRELETLVELFEEQSNEHLKKLFTSRAVEYLRERGYTVIHKDICLYEVKW